MRTLISLITALILLLPLMAAANSPLEKITVAHTNNYQLGREVSGMNLPDTLNNPAYDGLRAYLKPQPAALNETQDIITIAKWVHLRWAHDPFGSATPKTDALTLLKTVPAGSGFSCNEYSKVLRDMLRAHGFIARSITLQNKDIAYGGLGASHVAVEVFNNQYNKWVLIDAQWGFYPTHNSMPINAYDIYELKKSGKFTQIKFISFSKLDTDKRQQDLSEYKAFLTNYLGYITVELLADQDKTSVIHALEARQWPLTFQGLPRNNQIFSSQLRDIYFDLNRVSLALRYKPESQRLQHLQLDSGSDQEYLDKMPQFAAVPDFIVTPHHNMPWFSHYEYRIDRNQWQKLTEASFAWTLRKGSNQLEVRAVNSAGRPGPITLLQINYQ